MLAASLPSAPSVARDGGFGECVRGIEAIRYHSYDLAINYCSSVIWDGQIPAAALQWILEQRAYAYSGNSATDRELAGRIAADALASQILYEQALRTNPDSAFVYLYTALLQARREEVTAAAASLTEAIQLQPDFAISYYNRGLAYLYVGQWPEALADFDATSQMLQAFAFAHYNRGWIHAAMGRHEETIAAYSEAVRLEPAFADAHNNRGFSQDALGDRDGAITDFAKTVWIAPKSEQYRAKVRELRTPW